MLTLLKGEETKSAELKKAEKELKKLYDTDQLNKFQGCFVTNGLKVLAEREGIYGQLFSLAVTSSLPGNRFNNRCTVNIEEKKIEMIVEDFGSGKEYIRHHFGKGDSNIKSFKFWKIKIEGYRNDFFVLTLPIE